MSPSTLDVALLHVPKPVHLTPEHGIVSFVNFPAFGLFSIASALDLAGFRAQIVHLGVERLRGELADLPRHLRESGVRVIGISLHWHPATFDALETARWLKRELPDVAIVLGGITASFFAKEALDFEGVDYVIEGDGERALAELATVLLREPTRSLDTVPNLWRRGADGAVIPPRLRHADSSEELGRYDFACLDRVKNARWLPFMNWALPADAPVFSGVMRMVQRARPHLRPFTMYLGRGCPISCPICGGNAKVMRERFARKGFNAIPARTLLRVTEKALAGGFTHMVSDMGLGIGDDELLELFAVIEESGLAPRWSLSMPSIPSLEVTRALVRATRGNCWLSLTAESGSDRVRERFRGAAAFTNEALLAFLAVTEREGIPSQVVFSRNLPLDPSSATEHASETARLKAHMKPFATVTPVNYNVQLDPGSGMFHDPDRFHCTPLWRTLRDYHEANRVPDSGPGFLSAIHTEPRWNGVRTAQIEMLEARILNAGLRAGGALERTARRWTGISSAR